MHWLVDCRLVGRTWLCAIGLSCNDCLGVLIGLIQGSKKPGFKKNPNPLGFFWVFGFYCFFLDKQEKIGKIIQNSVTQSLKSFKTIKMHY